MNEAKINGKLCRLYLDTGGHGFWLFRAGAERLGVDVRQNRSWLGSRKSWWATEPCRVEWWGCSVRTRCYIYELPSVGEHAVDADGFIGWPQAGKTVVVFDAVNGKLNFLLQVPQEATGWTKLPLRTRWKSKNARGVLGIEVPQADGSKGVIIVDTGSDSGVGLAPKKWGEWTTAHPNQPSTLTAGYAMSEGVLVREQAWADELRVGPVTLAGVVVEEAETWSTGKIAPEDHVATFGLAALKRLDLIVDAKHGVAYLRPKQTPPLAYDHNRLGAVFVPKSIRTNDLVAHVAERSPAFAAGIRNGDLLLRVDDREVTPATLTAFWVAPAGTKVTLTLKRGGETFKTTAVLQEILSPESTPPAKPTRL